MGSAVDYGPDDCGPNEYLEQCATDTACDAEYCPSSAWNVRSEDCPQPDPDNCSSRCMCNPGFLKDESGNCVPKRQCPLQCTGRNEEVNDCPLPCPGESCADATVNPASCIRRHSNPLYCQAACRCMDGHFRDEEGECVPYKQCPPVPCPSGEFLDTCPRQYCGSPFCPTAPYTVHSCPALPGDKCGTPKCRCNFNTRRSRQNGTCIPIKDCPSFKCPGPNEEHQACPRVCPGESCADYLSNAKCPRFRIGIVVECKPGCRCKQGTYRDDDGVCVPASQCHRCPKGEIFNKCAPQKCAAEYCPTSDYTPTKCPPSKPCVGRCVCDGFQDRRDSNGKCISGPACPPYKCSRANETFSGCQRCENCSEIRSDGVCSPLPIGVVSKIVVPCVPGCYCSDGYFRKGNGDCVLRSECGCPKGEVFNKCAPQKCAAEYCPTSDYTPTECPPSKPCVGRCVCDGFQDRRDSNGKCISGPACPPYKCSRANETFSGCQRCENCSEIRSDGVCSPLPIGAVSKIVVPCVPGCYCSDGYFRKGNGDCVLRSECGCPKGEVFNKCAPQKCAAEYCPTSDQTPAECPPSKPCVGRCVCDGFQERRDKYGKCISAPTCPAFKCSRPNEQFLGCQKCENCSDIRSDGSCSRVPFGVSLVAVPCVPGCYCSSGYYRTVKGDCVLKNKCPQFGCNGDLNAHTGCGVPCGRTCKARGPCSDICLHNACDCNDGYLLDEEKGICVKPEQCSTAVAVSGTAAGDDDQKNAELFSQSTATFTSKFYTEVAKANGGSSTVMSALSLEPLLAQLSLGAVGESHDQMLSVLGIPSDNYTRSVFRDVIGKLQATKGVVLRLAASLYVPYGLELNEDFQKDSVDIFHSKIENVDFSKSVEAAKTINDWVEQNTNNKIHELVSSDDLGPSTRLVMCNAIYFKGDWKTKFDPKLTQDKEFHISNSKTVQIPTMYMESRFKYAESAKLNAKLLQIPYAGDEAFMLIVLPNEVEGLKDVNEKLKDPSVLQEEMKTMQLLTVQVQIPKFKISTTTNLKTVLKAMGIDLIFDSARAGLVNLVKSTEPLFVSDAIQKAFIEVNEEGAEAAAANALVTYTRALYARENKLHFKADRPFLFALVGAHRELFTGMFRN